MLRWTVRLRGPDTANQTALTVRHCVYCFGEDWRGNKKQIGVHVFNTVALTWRNLTPVNLGRGEVRHLLVPSWRTGFSAVLVEDTAYIWGSECGVEHYNVLYAFDVDAHRWFEPQVSGTVPTVRYNHSACALGKVMFIHGGYMTRWINDMYKLDTSTMFWALINTRGTPPPASSRHSATIIGTKMFVFGGWSGRERFNTAVRVFDTENELWLDTPSAQLLHPGERSCCDHSAFTYHGELYICRGWNTIRPHVQYFNDLWKFNPETFSWKRVKPSGRGPYTDVYKRYCCIVGDRVILFGRDKDTSSQGMFILDLSPSLKTLSKLAVIHCCLDQSELPHDIRWELTAMTTNGN